MSLNENRPSFESGPNQVTTLYSGFSKILNEHGKVTKQYEGWLGAIVERVGLFKIIKYEDTILINDTPNNITIFKAKSMFPSLYELDYGEYVNVNLQENGSPLQPFLSLFKAGNVFERTNFANSIFPIEPRQQELDRYNQALDLLEAKLNPPLVDAY
jgi:hypothetical protein